MSTITIRSTRRAFCRRFLWSMSGLACGFKPFTINLGKHSVREESAATGIRALRLKTAHLEKLRTFYRTLFHFPLVAESANAITLQAGSTALTFEQTENNDDPFYHFAFNIPENKLESAKAWLKQRVPLASRDGREVYHFTSWNAHSIYYWDAGGNLGELIARHDLPNARAGDFAPDDILYASEIGLVVEDVPASVNWIERDLNVPVYRAGSNEFAPMGDEHQLLIVAKKPRPWMDRASEIFSTSAILTGESRNAIVLPQHPYQITFQI